MKHHNSIGKFLTFALFLFLMFSSLTSTAVNRSMVDATPESISTVSTEDMLNLDRHALEIELGRKLKWKERVGLKILNKKIRKASVKNKQAAVNAEGEIKPVDAMAVLSLIFGIIGLIVAGIIFGVLAITFGLISYSRIKNNPESKRGLGTAKAGVILGFISIIGAIIFIAML